MSNLIKRKVKGSVSRIHELGVTFDYDGSVTDQDAQEILEKVRALHERALQAIPRAKDPACEEALRAFSGNLKKVFYGFEADFFQHNLARIVDEVISVIKGSIELWPTLVEITYFQKGRHGLPTRRVENGERRSG